MDESKPWSLVKRLNSYILLVTVMITLMVSVAVAIHYGYDVAELRQRTVFDLAEAVAEDLPADKTGVALAVEVNERHDIFNEHDAAYEWVILDGRGYTVSAEEFPRVDRTRLPPGLPPAEWSAPSSQGGWQAGKTFIVDGKIRHVIVTAHSDPAGLLTGLVIGEALMHVILPLAPFALLITLFTSRIIKHTLQPLGSLATQAMRVRNLEDIRPLDPKGAPIEVTELVNALNTALEGLRVSMTKEKDFLLDASHALRTPLAVVKARLELDGDKIDRQKLSDEVEALIRLTSQLLASANAERLAIDTTARADLTELARDVVSSMTPLAIQAGVDLGYSEKSAKAEVCGDSDAISHALRSLIENALKYTPPGKAVTVQVADDPPTLTITDEGPGVPAIRRDKIFERHSRSQFVNGSGAGLGLSIVRRIMTAHRGKIDLIDTPDGGASFRMTFNRLPIPSPAQG
ncbi:MAG: HAMP domain-containing histidine kinase [Burkholderiales bacterium]|nr:MAG: HAMP domain-containing histidine kinase [Burkholderiales bacterium]